MADLENSEAAMEDLEMDSEEEAPTTRSDLDSSEDEVSEDVNELGIFKEVVDTNYMRMGEEVQEEEPSLKLAELRGKYPEALSTEFESLLLAVLENLQLPYMLSDYQA
jgi:hypothetical protein